MNSIIISSLQIYLSIFQINYAMSYVYNPFDWINGYYFPHVDIPQANSLLSSNPNFQIILLPPISATIGAGLRTPLFLPQYIGTTVHHLLTLPEDWSVSAVASGKRWPVIVVYTGNSAPSLGSTGIHLPKEFRIIYFM